MTSCEEMVLNWARVYASHGRIGHKERGRLKSKEFMQLWALPALSAQETEEYMFQVWWLRSWSQDSLASTSHPRPER